MYPLYLGDWFKETTIKILYAVLMVQLYLVNWIIACFARDFVTFNITTGWVCVVVNTFENKK